MVSAAINETPFSLKGKDPTTLNPTETKYLSFEKGDPFLMYHRYFYQPDPVELNATNKTTIENTETNRKNKELEAVVDLTAPIKPKTTRLKWKTSEE